MFLLIGLVVVMVMVFGGFALAGGKFEIIIKALPFELMIIFGGSIGAFISGNNGKVVKGGIAGVTAVLKGPKWSAEDYKDLLCMLFLVVKTIRSKGVVAIEAHIENPEESKIFQQFPKVASDHHVVEMICDYVRMMTMNFEDANQMEDALKADLEKHHKEEHEAQHALQTMASINEPVEVLGALIGSALVGTFLGIFLGYLLIGPISNRFNQILEEEGYFMELIRIILVAHLQGNAPQVSVDLGRRMVPSRLMPSFQELEEAIAELPTDI